MSLPPVPTEPSEALTGPPRVVQESPPEPLRPGELVEANGEGMARLIALPRLTGPPPLNEEVAASVARRQARINRSPEPKPAAVEPVEEVSVGAAQLVQEPFKPAVSVPVPPEPPEALQRLLQTPPEPPPIPLRLGEMVSFDFEGRARLLALQRAGLLPSEPPVRRERKLVRPQPPVFGGSTASNFD